MKLTFTLIALYFSLELMAQKAGTLDSSFGANGEVITNFPNDYALAYDAAIEKNNTIIVTGYGYISPFNDTVGILLLNYLQNGSLNSNFGDNGRIIFNFPGYIFSNGRTVYIQPDGKIIIAGFGTKNDSDPNQGDLILLRINPDGSFDPGFGENGLVSRNFGKPPTINSIQVQPDGKILVGGSLSSDFFLTRYSANGTIDENFGNDGYVLTSISGIAAMNAIAVEPNGKILTAGVTDFESAFAQYMEDGSLDKKNTNTFNVANSHVNSIAMEDDGSFVVAGLAGRLFEAGTLVAKFKSIGVIDSSFGTNGNTILDFGTANSVFLQTDNKIIVAGTGSSKDTSEFMAFRLQSNGMFDSSFGTNGIAFANFGYSYVPVVFKGFSDNTGKIVLTGNASGDQYNGHTILLARYNNDESRKQILITKIRKWIQHHNGIEWDNTGSENSYVVQRSYDGIHFNSVARITPGNQSYITYNDPAPLNSTNYYRLQTTSASNAVTNSNVIAISNNNIKVSPNPAQSILHIEGLSSSQNTKLTVVDFNGNIAISQKLSANSYSCDLNIASLYAGNYLLKIETNGELVTKQFVKE